MINKTNIEERLNRIISENGNDIASNNINEKLDIDSITFVSLIVEIENEFDIEIPDDYLLIEKLGTYSQFLDMIIDLLEKKI